MEHAVVKQASNGVEPVSRAWNALAYYRWTVLFVLMVLSVGEILLAYRFVQTPFGRDIKLDTSQENDLYWPVTKGEGGCPDCPKQWQVDKKDLEIPFVFEKPNRPEFEWIHQYVQSFLKGYTTDFEVAMGLTNHIHSVTDYVTSDRTYARHVDLVKDVLKGGKFWCGGMSKAMVTASLSMGRAARLIHLQTAQDGDPNYQGHYAVEIWIPAFNKWVLFDPTINAFYRLEGHPASVLEVHRAVVQGKGQDVQVMKEGVPHSLDTYEDTESLPGILFKNYFTYFQVLFRNDFLANGDHVHPANDQVVNYYLNWSDDYTPPFYFDQELPGLAAKIGMLFGNGLLIAVLTFRLTRKSQKV
ncbi:MAG: transglutaminase-like domain-containing protein [Nitrospirae bacterium]|nr:transglutaminase-like domain-containing protein [Nitrospirota bacterium]